MQNWTKKTLKSLHQAGWFENREININEFRQALREEGFVMPNKAAQFLKVFGKLKIEQLCGDYFHFDVAEAVESVDPDWIKEDYSKRAGEKLCIIGEAFNGYMTVCMSPQGRVYAGFDDTLVYAGASGNEAIETLSLGYELTEVPELDVTLGVQLKKSVDDCFDKIQSRQIQNLIDQHKFYSILQQGKKAFLPQFKNAVIEGKYSSNSTQECLEKMLGVYYGSGIRVVIGLHPKDMKKSAIKDYMITAAKEQGSFLNRNNIKTRYIPATQYALTAFIEKTASV